MEYYHDLITEKSFKALQNLKRRIDFVLIGGWAVFLYTKSLKSKDIDVIVDYDELDKLKTDYDISKNERLKKYEVKTEDIDIDIYLPFYSELGVKVEDIKQNTQSIEGFIVPIPEILLILKTITLRERKGTNKGRKDVIDLFSLLEARQIDWQKFKKLIKQYDVTEINKELKDIIISQRSILELDLRNHKMSKLKKEVLDHL